MAEASQNAYLVLIFYYNPCLKRSDQSYISQEWSEMHFCVRVMLVTIPLLLLKAAIATAQDTNPVYRSTDQLSVSNTPLLHPFSEMPELGDMAAIAQLSVPSSTPLASPEPRISKAARDLLPVDRSSEPITAQAEPASPAAPPTEKNTATAAPDANAAKLAQAAQNPIASLISVPLQNNFNAGIGPLNQTQYVLNVQPVIPVSLGPGWLVVNRIITPMINQPTIRISPPAEPGFPPELDSAYTFGLGDINPQFYFVPKTQSNITWGIGPQFILPTATTRVTGSGKWGIGPVGVIVYTHSNWVIGVLATQAWSFAGDSDRAPVSQFLVQPFVNYNLPKGWYLTTGPQITANWMAEPDNQWTLPLGGGIGKLFKVGQQPVNASLSAYGNVVRPENGPSWTLRFQVQLLFPTGS